MHTGQGHASSHLPKQVDPEALKKCLKEKRAATKRPRTVGKVVEHINQPTW